MHSVAFPFPCSWPGNESRTSPGVYDRFTNDLTAGPFDGSFREGRARVSSPGRMSFGTPATSRGRRKREHAELKIHFCLLGSEGSSAYPSNRISINNNV